MCKMLISDGSASWYYDSTVNYTYYHDFDGVEYDVGVYYIVNIIYVKKLSMNSGIEQWSNLFALNASLTEVRVCYVLISKDQSKVYSFIAIKYATFSIFWTVFDFATGSVVGNRYLANINIWDVYAMADTNDFVYVFLSKNPNTFVCKYEKSTDTFIAYMDSI